MDITYYSIKNRKIACVRLSGALTGNYSVELKEYLYNCLDKTLIGVIGGKFSIYWEC